MIHRFVFGFVFEEASRPKAWIIFLMLLSKHVEIIVGGSFLTARRVCITTPHSTSSQPRTQDNGGNQTFQTFFGSVYLVNQRVKHWKGPVIHNSKRPRRVNRFPTYRNGSDRNQSCYGNLNAYNPCKGHGQSRPCKACEGCAGASNWPQPIGPNHGE